MKFKLSEDRTLQLKVTEDDADLLNIRDLYVRDGCGYEELLAKYLTEELFHAIWMWNAYNGRYLVNFDYYEYDGDDLVITEDAEKFLDKLTQKIIDTTCPGDILYFSDAFYALKLMKSPADKNKKFLDCRARNFVNFLKSHVSELDSFLIKGLNSDE